MSLAPSCGCRRLTHIITSQTRPPPALLGRPSSFAPLHQLDPSVTFQDCPFIARPRPRPRPLDRDSARQLGPAHPPPPLTHASPLYRIVVSTPPIHCPSFRTLCSPGQSQQTARCQRGQHSLGGPPDQTASTGPPEIATLFASHRAHIPVPLSARVAEPTSPCLNAHSERRPQISRTHCRQSQPPDAEAHSSPTTPRQPGRLTLPLPLALTSQPSQRSTLQPGRFPWLKLLAPGLQEQGQARRYHPMIVAWLGIDLANPVPLSLEQIFNSCP